MRIKIIDFKDLSKCEGALDEFNIILYNKPQITYFGLFKDDDLVAVMAVENKGNFLKMRANYTPLKYRKHGYGYYLLHNVCNLFRNKSLVVEANDWSKSLYTRNGFIVTGKRKCKYWTKYFMRREVTDGKTKN